MYESSVSFQMFLILLSSIALGSESRISGYKQCQSNTQMSGLFFFGGGGGVSMRTSQIKISVKKNPEYGTSLGSISRVFH